MVALVSEREADVIDFLLESTSTVTQAARKLGMKASNLSVYLRKLVALRLVTATREGSSKKLAAESWLFPAFTNARNRLRHLKPSDLLVGKTPFLLAFAANRSDFKIRQTGLPPATAKRLIKKLRSNALVFMPSRGTYRLREDAREAAGFCRLFLTNALLKEAGSELKGIKQAFFSFDSAREVEAVFVTWEKSDARTYHPTAFSVFHEYGIKLITGGRYFYANVRPRAEDAVCHALAAGTDARSIALCAALLYNNPSAQEKLLGKKQRFGLDEKLIENLVKFVRSRGGVVSPGFPDWKEVEEVM